MFWSRTNQTVPRICVSVAGVDETKHEVRETDLHVARVERVQSHELAGQTCADELPALIELNRSIGTDAVNVGKRIVQR